jgi:hypothetical protein
MRTQFKTLQRTLSMFALTLAGFVSAGAAPAHALVDNYLFGFTGGVGTQELILNGGEYVLQATQTGWVNSNGTNNHGAGNYIVGNDAGVTYEDYFTFNLAHVTGTITSATFSIWNPNNGFTGGPGILSLHGIKGESDSAITTAGIGLYDSIAASPIAGSAYVDSTSNGTNILVNANAYALKRLNLDEGQFINGGGTFTSAVPLPAGLPMFALALLGMFAAVQFRNQCKAA